MDIADHASEYEQRNRQSALTKAREASVGPAQLTDAGGVVLCVDCEEPVEPARLKALPNAARCVCCQSVFEMSRK